MKRNSVRSSYRVESLEALELGKGLLDAGAAFVERLGGEGWLLLGAGVKQNNLKIDEWVRLQRLLLDWS